MTELSVKALRNHNALPVPDSRNDCYNQGNFIKAIPNIKENYDKLHSKRLLLSTTSDNSEIGNIVEAVDAVVEYVESENLSDVDDPKSILDTLLSRLDSKDWIAVCEALNHVRQLSIFHKEAMLESLGMVIPLIVKSLQNPRSAICKTAIMACADVFKAYGDSIIISLDPLLVQLLLKSSQDKRFLGEVAERALTIMITWMSPPLLLPKLEPYLKHKNPRIRAKSSIFFCKSVPHLGKEGIHIYGIDKLIKIASSLLNDRLPETRDAARNLSFTLQTVYQATHSSVPPGPESSLSHSWEDFCRENLSPLSAQAIIRATSIAKDALPKHSS